MGKAKTGNKPAIQGQGSLGAFFGQKPKPAAPPVANAAPAPSPAASPAEKQPASAVESKQVVQPSAAPSASPSPIMAASQPTATPSGGGLTEEQKKRIEENRRKALERQQLKRAHAELEKGKGEEPADKKPKEEPPAAKKGEDVPAQQAAAEKPEEEEDTKTASKQKKNAANAKAKAKAAAKALFGASADKGETDDATGKQKRSRSTAKAKAGRAKQASSESLADAGETIQSPPPKKSPGRELCPDKDTPEKDPLPLERRASAGIEGIPARRQGTSVEACTTKFQTFGTVAWMQYNSYYNVRLQKLRGSALAKAHSLWSGDVPPSNFLQNIIGYKGVLGEVVLVGILHKEMSARPNIIDIYSKSKVVGSLPEDLEGSNPSFCSDDDKLWLEDESLRVQLQLPGDEVAKFATGIVAGVRGSATNDGKFQVKGICFTSTPAPVPLPCSAPHERQGTPAGPYLALVSGFKFGAPGVDPMARTSVLDFLLGSCEEESGRMLSSNIQHVVVCGGIFGSAAGERVSTSAIAEADSFLAKLASELPVDVIPGHRDPTNLSMPQMPLHPHLFRAARKCSHFRSMSNPYECTLGGLRVLGHGGQPVDDLLRCTRLQSPLEALKTTLDASILAPTAPDTLGTQPFDKVDPFVIETAPHILFSGGHERTEYEWRDSADGSTGTLCVCVPAVSKNPVVVLINLKNPRDLHVQEFAVKQETALNKDAAEAGA